MLLPLFSSTQMAPGHLLNLLHYWKLHCTLRTVLKWLGSFASFFWGGQSERSFTAPFHHTLFKLMRGYLPPPTPIIYLLLLLLSPLSSFEAFIHELEGGTSWERSTLRDFCNSVSLFSTTIRATLSRSQDQHTRRALLSVCDHAFLSFF